MSHTLQNLKSKIERLEKEEASGVMYVTGGVPIYEKIKSLKAAIVECEKASSELEKYKIAKGA